MKQIIQDIDIYGEGLVFRIDNKETTKTYVGGVLTIATAILVIILFLVLSADLFYHLFPNSYSESTILNSYPDINLSRNNYPIAFYIGDSLKENVYNTSIFKLEANLVTNTQNELEINTITNRLNISICTQDHFPNITKTITEQVVGIMYCIDQQNVTLKGYWTESSWSFLEINALICNNKTNNNCLNDKAIENYINDIQPSLNLLTVEKTLQITNFSYPFVNYSNIPSSYIVNGLTKYNSFNILNNSLKTDTNFFTQMFQERNYIKMEVDQKDFAPIDPEERVAVTFALYSNKQKSTHYRSYIKITDIFGSLGGILKLIMIVFKIINMPFSDIQKYSNICNLLTDSDTFSTEKFPQNKNILNSKIKIANSKIDNQVIDGSQRKMISRTPSYNASSIEKNSFVSNIPIQDAIKPKANLDNDSNNSKRKKRVKLNAGNVIWIKIKRMFNCKIEKQADINQYSKYIKISDSIEKFFEVPVLINKIMKVDKLKQILMNPKEAELFDVLYEERPVNNNEDDLAAINVIEAFDKENRVKIDEFLKISNKDESQLRLEELVVKYNEDYTKADSI